MRDPTLPAGYQEGKFSAAEIDKLEIEIAEDPLKGDLIPKTGGLRKIRFAARGKGKRGGGRAIYFYLVDGEDVYLLRAYAKADEVDLSAADRRAAAILVRTVIEERDDGEEEG